ncbi:unnamed protein product (macronuclear) [Paramecium tetraurelia]|uniref:Ammonium transporter AmtB-like domain-containing protein n=1 Tax=Paramecium tetraurelia TaxID=5888 RepID=A0CZV1_PARTE|nr:uncharacterized protein GSPATT00011891001 [Paramecium tetraurelia]CAK76318.1 unnamed protein product [Paramecium tetraurelia]|eukprot:XP_001443715.1 hypothetical protein (macronuclear) [Paramecium tetraurelia strain d4-2]
MNDQFNQAHYDIKQEIQHYEHDLDHFWTALTGAVVLIMQLGFAFLEGGCVRYRNIQSIIIKVYANTAISIIMMWIVGYGLMMGKTNDTQFNGISGFAGFRFKDHPESYADFIFNAALAAAANSIVSGGAAERMSIPGYIALSALFSGFIYPICIHWAFKGWLYDLGYHDFAGSGAIHLTAGIGALVVTYMLRPRTNRFNPQFESQFKPANTTFICLSCLTLYMAWMCFNSGSTLALSDGSVFTVGNSIANTMVGGASGGLFVFFYHYFTNRNTDNQFSLVMVCNGNLAGLVAVTGSNDEIEQWAAFVIGIIGGIIYVLVAKILHKLHIDDPVDAIPIHAGCGLAGAMCPGWFDRRRGIYYEQGAYQWGVQVLGCVCFVAWSAAWHYAACRILEKMGLLRVNNTIELEGLDPTICGGHAFFYESIREQEMKEPFSFQRDVQQQEQAKLNEIEFDDRNLSIIKQGDK